MIPFLLAATTLPVGASVPFQEPASLQRELPAAFGEQVQVEEFDPVARAVELARPTVAFYASIPQYRSFFEAHGFADVVDRIVEARRSQSIEEAARLVPDSMARTFVVCGDRDTVAATLDRLWTRADSMMVRPPVWGVAPAEQAARRVELEALLLG